MKLKLAFGILWLAILLTSSAYAADDQTQTQTQLMQLATDQDMFGAFPDSSAGFDSAGQKEYAMYYPGGPTSPGPTQQQMAMGYPTAMTYTPPSGYTPPYTGTTGTPPYTGTYTGGTPTALYTTTAPPTAQQNVLMSYNIQSAPPTSVYYSGSFVPWTTFNTMMPSNQPMFWVATSAGWAWYASCPIGAWLQNLMYIPYPGALKVYELYPDGHIRFYNYGWASPGYKYIWFYADTSGRHITFLTLTDKPSNYVTVDVY